MNHHDFHFFSPLELRGMFGLDQSERGMFGLVQFAGGGSDRRHSVTQLGSIGGPLLGHMSHGKRPQLADIGTERKKV